MTSPVRCRLAPPGAETLANASGRPGLVKTQTVVRPSRKMARKPAPASGGFGALPRADHGTGPICGVRGATGGGGAGWREHGRVPRRQPVPAGDARWLRVRAGRGRERGERGDLQPRALVRAGVPGPDGGAPRTVDVKHKATRAPGWAAGHLEVRFLPEPMAEKPAAEPPAASFASATTQQSACEPRHDSRRRTGRSRGRWCCARTRASAAYTSKSGSPAIVAALLHAAEPSMRKSQFDRTLPSKATTASHAAGAVAEDARSASAAQPAGALPSKTVGNARRCHTTTRARMLGDARPAVSRSTRATFPPQVDRNQLAPPYPDESEFPRQRRRDRRAVPLHGPLDGNHRPSSSRRPKARIGFVKGAAFSRACASVIDAASWRWPISHIRRASTATTTLTTNPIRSTSAATVGLCCSSDQVSPHFYCGRR
jgi:hypothetical protein